MRLSLGSGTELRMGGGFCLSFYGLPCLYGLTFFFLITTCIYFYYLKRKVLDVSEKSFLCSFYFGI